MTLDPKIAAELERVRTTDGRRFDEVLNDALRIGLAELSRTSGEQPFTSPTRPRNLGEPIIDIADTSTAITEADGENHR